jgi:hypothetical protein
MAVTVTPAIGARSSSYTWPVTRKALGAVEATGIGVADGTLLGVADGLAPPTGAPEG